MARSSHRLKWLSRLGLAASFVACAPPEPTLSEGARLSGSLSPLVRRFRGPEAPLWLTVTATGADVALFVNGRRLDLLPGPAPERIAIPGEALLELRGAFSSTGGFVLETRPIPSPAPWLALSERVLSATARARKFEASETRAAAEALEAAAVEAVALEAPAWEGELLLASAELYAKLGDPRAEGAYSRALQRVVGPARVLAELGLAAWVLDRGDTSRAAAAQGRARSAMGTEPYLIARVELAEGNAARDRGENAQGLAALERAARIGRVLGDPALIADVEAGLGWCHKELGDRAATLAHFQAGAAAAEASGDGRALGMALHNLGIIPSDFDHDHRAALQWFERAIDAQRKAGYPGLAYSLDAAGEMESSLGLAKALDRHQEALILRRQLKSVRGEAQTLISLGNAATRLGQPEEAIAPLIRSAELLASVGDRTWEAYAYERLGLAELARGRPEEAYRQAMRALEISESLRERIASEDRRAYYTAEVRSYYDLAVAAAATLAAQTGSRQWMERSFSVAEQSRSRALLDMMMLIEPEDPDQALRLEIRALDQAARKAKAQGASPEGSGPVTGGMNPPAGAIASPDALAEIEAALLPKLAEFERRQQGRGASDPRRSAPLATLSEAQALLDPATLLVELHLGRAGAFAIVVGTSTLGAFALGPSGPIEEDARQLHRRYAARNEQPPEERAEARAERIAVADREAAALATALDQRLVGPWRGLLAGKSRVVVVPDGALHYLPFAPFFPGLAVTSLPSLTVLLAQRRASAPAGGTTLVVMGDPVFDLDDPRATEDAQRAALREAGPSRVQRLPFTRRESEAVASLVPASARRLWLDFDATKDKLGPALGRPRYLHLATHGVLDAAHPERSGLLFSRTTADGRPQDGFLSLAEIYDLELKSELVTLSACETALGAEVRGEGLIGLTRGFLHAGARAVLASLWKVNDQATERLMRAFYRGLLEQHLPPAVALARAQEALRSEERYRAPYYWAGFVLQGEFGAARPKHW